MKTLTHIVLMKRWSWKEYAYNRIDKPPTNLENGCFNVLIFFSRARTAYELATKTPEKKINTWSNWFEPMIDLIKICFHFHLFISFYILHFVFLNPHPTFIFRLFILFVFFFSSQIIDWKNQSWTNDSTLTFDTVPQKFKHKFSILIVFDTAVCMFVHRT